MNETMGMSYASLYYAEIGKNNELQKENKKLKELCDKYEEEHNTTFEEWQKDIKANKKAVEYIKKHKDERKYYHIDNRFLGVKIFVEGYYELLDILQGDNK